MSFSSIIKQPVNVEAYGLSEFTTARPVPAARRDKGAELKNAADLQREAYEKGFKAGEDAGYAFGEKKARLIVDRLNSVMNELSMLRERILADIEPEVVALSVEIARRVVHAEIETNPDVVLNIAREALRRVTHWRKIVIHVNPADYEYIASRRGELAERNKNITIEKDDAILAGGCFIQEEVGEIDGRIDEQLNEIAQELAVE